MATPPKSKIIDRQALASEAVDLVLTKLVRQLKTGAEVSPALVSSVLAAAKAMGVDLAVNHQGTSPVRDKVLESLRDVNLDDLLHPDRDKGGVMSDWEH